jgi:hypothetical protein
MSQPSKGNQNIADVAFIIGELNRFAAMDPTDVILHISDHREDAFATLRGARGGIVFCGKAAYDRFEALADRTIKPGSAEAKRFDRRDYLTALHEAFADIFIAGAQPVTEGAVMKFFNRARELAQDELAEVTHHLPCVVFYEHDLERFVIGPVTFALTTRFLGDLQAEIEKYRRANAAAFAAGLRKRQPDLSAEQVTAEAEAFADRHIDLIRRYYEEFDWVASVQIPAAHAGISQTRAERAVDAALDVLRRFVPTFPERYRRAGAPNTPFETRELMTDAAGKSSRQCGRVAVARRRWKGGTKVSKATRLNFGMSLSEPLMR